MAQRQRNLLVDLKNQRTDVEFADIDRLFHLSVLSYALTAEVSYRGRRGRDKPHGVTGVKKPTFALHPCTRCWFSFVSLFVFRPETQPLHDQMMKKKLSCQVHCRHWGSFRAARVAKYTSVYRRLLEGCSLQGRSIETIFLCRPWSAPRAAVLLLRTGSCHQTDQTTRPNPDTTLHTTSACLFVAAP